MDAAHAFSSERARLILEAARSGDAAVWEELFDEHYPQLYRFFRSRVPGDTLAEDLAADVFAEAWRSRGGLRWRRRPFAAWLFGIARHRLASFYRDRPPDARELTSDDEPIGQVHNEFLAVELRDVLDGLRADYRQAIELRYVVGLANVEAAAVMDRSPGAFRTLLHRALQSCRDALDFSPPDAAGGD